MRISSVAGVLAGVMLAAGLALGGPASPVHVKGTITANPPLKTLLFVPFNKGGVPGGQWGTAEVAPDGSFDAALPAGNYLVVQHPPGTCASVAELRLAEPPAGVYLELAFSPGRVTLAPGTTTTVERQLALGQGVVGRSLVSDQVGLGVVGMPPPVYQPPQYLAADKGGRLPPPQPKDRTPPPDRGGKGRPKPGGGEGLPGPDWPKPAPQPGTTTIPTIPTTPIISTPLPLLTTSPLLSPTFKLPGGINLGAALVCSPPQEGAGPVSSPSGRLP